MFEKVELSFLVDTSEYVAGKVVSDVTGFLYGRGLIPSVVKEVYCGEVDLVEAVEEWSVDPQMYGGEEDDTDSGRG